MFKKYKLLLAVIIIGLIAFIELLCIKYNFGLAIFDASFASIVENICYSLIAACIFYIFFDFMPFLQKYNDYESLLNTKKRNIKTSYNILINYLLFNKYFQKSPSIIEYKINSEKLLNTFNQQWEKCIYKLKRRSKNLKENIIDH